MEFSNLTRRAIAAYFKHSSYPALPCQPCEYSSGEEEHDGKAFVVLRNANGVLAVYRVRAHDGVLKRLKRWPSAIEDHRQPETYGELRGMLAEQLMALDRGEISAAQSDAALKRVQKVLKAQ